MKNHVYHKVSEKQASTEPFVELGLGQPAPIESACYIKSRCGQTTSSNISHQAVRSDRWAQGTLSISIRKETAISITHSKQPYFLNENQSKFVPILPQPVPHHQAKSRQVMKCPFETQVLVQEKADTLTKFQG